MSPLGNVLIFQFFLAILNIVGTSTLNEAIWMLYDRLSFSTSNTTAARERRAREELIRLNAEFKATSAQDEFAKWATLKRKIDRLQDEHQSLVASRNATQARVTASISAIRIILVYGLRFYMQIRYSRQAMFWLPKGWMPWAGEWILSFPLAPLGAVSVQVWQMACSTVMQMVVDAVLAVVTLVNSNLGFARPKSRASKQSQPQPQPQPT